LKKIDANIALCYLVDLTRLGVMKNESFIMKTQIAIFASGSGTNAENLIQYFQNHPQIEVGLVFSNKPTAGVIARAYKYDVPVVIGGKKLFHSASYFLSVLDQHKIRFIVLAGFMWLVPDYLTAKFDRQMVNIHPALLPKYGGKGMYGNHVHQAVVANGEKTTGITVHYVNREYDEGNIIFQAECPVSIGDTPEQVAEKVHKLEYKYYPRVVEQLLEKG
jgi:phosphoribosylglycinamide formyltransferase-1